MRTRPEETHARTRATVLHHLLSFPQIYALVFLFFQISNNKNPGAALFLQFYEKHTEIMLQSSGIIPEKGAISFEHNQSLMTATRGTLCATFSSELLNVSSHLGKKNSVFYPPHGIGHIPHPILKLLAASSPTYPRV